MTGADVGAFEIIGSALRLKAGTVLNHVTKPSYSITVQVDDTNVGNTPDATVAYSLTITAPSGAATLVISEVAAWSSGNSTLTADWFEITNVGTASANITGWKIDDNSNNATLAATLSGVTTIAPGESVIFIETADLAGKSAAFNSIWFGGSPPPGLQIGNYTGGGLGLGSGGDAVNLFDSGGALMANVVFGANAPALPGPFRSFDNAAGANSATITALSAVGINGAFSVTDVVSAGVNGSLIGSPGTIGAGATSVITITATDASASEVGANPGTFRISRTGSITSSLTANFTIATGAGQATSGDYTPAIGTSAVIPAGQTFVDITITPVGDTLAEGSETLTLTLFDTGSYDVGSPDVATVTIADNAATAAFAAWLSANGYTGTLGGDTDGDGLPDGLEYFFNANPNHGGDRDNLPQVVINGNDLEFRFTYLSSSVLPGFLKCSEDLTGWADALPGIDYEVIGETVNGSETAVRYRIFCNPLPTATGPFTYLTPFTSEVARGSTNNLTITNHGMVGAGRISGESVDSFGETMGAASGLSITGGSYNSGAGQFNGTFNVLPDRGYNSGTIFSNYAARVHQVPFTFTPYYGAGPVAQTQIVPTYSSTTKFTYLDGATTKFTTGLVPTGISTLFAQSIGTVTAANGPGGAQESLISFDAEAIHLFADGSGFVSDEYGTYIARFNAAKQFTRIIQLPDSAQPHAPAGTLNFAATSVNGRRNNQGLEGISVSPDNTRLFALLQSATVQDSGAAVTRYNARLYVYDIAGANLENPVLIAQHVVQLPRFDVNGNGSALDATAAQSEIIALSNTQLLMLPRDGNGLGKGDTNPPVVKTVDLVDFSAATNILGLYDAEGNQISPGGTLRATITPARSTVVVNLLSSADLARFGFNTNTAAPNAFTVNEKAEGMAIVPDTSTASTEDYFLFVANDNDFQSSDVKMLDATGALVSHGDARDRGITNDAVFTAWRITICPNNRKFFRIEVDIP